MRKPIVVFAITLFSLSAFILMRRAELSGFPENIVGVLVVLALPGLFNGRYFIFCARVLVPISYGVFAIALFSLGYENIAGSDFYRASNFGLEQNGDFIFEAEDNFFNALTVLFSVVSAFLLWKGLTDFDKLKETLNEEAENIWAIVFLTSYLREENDDSPENIVNIAATDKICRLFQDYVREAIGVQNISMRKASMYRLKNSDDLIDQCVGETKRIVVKKGDENDRIALEEMMKKLSHLVSIRSKRRVFMDTGMPPFVLASILLISIALLLPFFGNGADVMSVNHIYVFLLSTIHMFIFMTLVDLSSPFDGHFSIQLDAFEDADLRITELIKERER
mgnify:CR=1 FL=1|tara:strand:- start:116 stop:1126 length:1011 start_codon:yes stop_codon:yes gene_type:complete